MKKNKKITDMPEEITQNSHPVSGWEDLKDYHWVSAGTFQVLFRLFVLGVLILGNKEIARMISLIPETGMWRWAYGVFWGVVQYEVFTVFLSGATTWTWLKHVVRRNWSGKWLAFWLDEEGKLMVLHDAYFMHLAPKQIFLLLKMQEFAFQKSQGVYIGGEKYFSNFKVRFASDVSKPSSVKIQDGNGGKMKVAISVLLKALEDYQEQEKVFTPIRFLLISDLLMQGEAAENEKQESKVLSMQK